MKLILLLLIVTLIAFALFSLLCPRYDYRGVSEIDIVVAEYLVDEFPCCVQVLSFDDTSVLIHYDFRTDYFEEFEYAGLLDRRGYYVPPIVSLIAVSVLGILLAVITLAGIDSKKIGELKKNG